MRSADEIAWMARRPATPRPWSGPLPNGRRFAVAPSAPNAFAYGFDFVESVAFGRTAEPPVVAPRGKPTPADGLENLGNV